MEVMGTMTREGVGRREELGRAFDGIRAAAAIEEETRRMVQRLGATVRDPVDVTFCHVHEDAIVGAPCQQRHSADSDDPQLRWRRTINESASPARTNATS